MRPKRKQLAHFAILLRELGEKELARRLHVAPSTVKGWKRKGVPKSKLDRVEAALTRRRKAQKAQRFSQRAKRMKRPPTYEEKLDLLRERSLLPVRDIRRLAKKAGLTERQVFHDYFYAKGGPRTYSRAA